MRKFLLIILISIVSISDIFAQVSINEIVSANTFGLKDEDGEANDWIELYNSSDYSIDLKGYQLTDKPEGEIRWVFPSVTIPGKGFLVVFASGKNRKSVNLNYKTIIDRGAIWNYLVPSGTQPEGWRGKDFDDVSWNQGPSGFGFSDGDDATILPNVQTLYIRKEFTVDDPEAIQQILFHCDYDDGFIAFINGKEIARGNISGASADYSSVSLLSDREARIYTGGIPEEHIIVNPAQYLEKGKNILAVQGHNISSGSSDFSLIPFLTLVSESFNETQALPFVSVKKSYLHTDFSIKAEGEKIELFKPNGELAGSFPSVELLDDISYGRFPDGSNDLFYFYTPSPGKQNQNPTAEMIDDEIVFSHPAGFYSTHINITLSSKQAEGQIFYTLNGSVPTTNSQKYTGEIPIWSTTIIRAIVARNGIAGSPQTNSYIMGSNHTLPVASISTNPENLWDYYTGIYVRGPNAQSTNPYYGSNFWMDWEKPIHFEYFDKQKNLCIDQGAGVKIAGNWTRANAQKSLALFARKQYGKGKFDHHFFHDKSTYSHNNLILRNSGNDWQYTMLRDGLVSELAKGMNLERLAFQPSVLYLNGEYWGIHNLREKVNEHYFEANYGIDASLITILENNAVEVIGKNTEYNQMIAFANNQNLQTDASFNALANQMDIVAYIDYMIMQVYVHNDDWPGNNIKYWKYDGPGSKWRWILFDTDFGFGLYNTSKVSQNTLQFASATNGPSWPNPPWSTLLFRRLLTNNAFKQMFINRYADCLNTIFVPSFIHSKTDSIRSMISEEMKRHLPRWSQNFNSWNSNVEAVKTFASQRQSNVRGHIRSFFNLPREWNIAVNTSHASAGIVHLNSLKLSAFPFTGVYFQDAPIKLAAYPKQGFRFVRWEGTINSTNASISVNPTGTTSLKAVFEPTGSAVPQIVINEINYKSADDYDTGDWIELYNNSSYVVDLTGWRIEDSKPLNGYVFPSGMMIYPGEYLVLYSERSKFASRYPMMKNASGELSFSLRSDGEIIRLFSSDRTLIDQVVYLPSLPWPSEANGKGATLELVNPNTDNENGANWRPGINGGTPGRQNGTFNHNELQLVSNVPPACFPTRFSDFTTLKFNITPNENYRVDVFDLSGRIRQTVQGTAQNEGTQYIDLFMDTPVEKGMYLVRLKTSKIATTLKVVKQ